MHGLSLGIVNRPTDKQPKGRRFLVLGLVPDGVTSVLLVVGAREATVPVRDNLYSLAANQPILLKQLLES